jgi:hypothetical protein
MTGNIKPEDIKEDPNPGAEDSDLDFGDMFGDDGLTDDDEAALAAAAADKSKEKAGAKPAAKPAVKAAAKADAGKAAAAAAGEAGEEGEEEGDGDGDGGDGAGDGADGEGGEEDPRAAGAGARRTSDSTPRQGWVPPHRMREVSAQARAAELRVRELEQENARLTGGKDKPDPVAVLEGEIEPLYEQVEEARAEGRSRDAATLQRKIDAANRDISEIKASRTATVHALETAQKTAYDATVEEIEAKFPELNPENDELYDGELAQEVLDLARGLKASKGLTMQKALQKALTYVFKEEVLESGTAHLYQKAGEAKKGEPKKGAEATEAGKAAGAKRKGEAVKNNLAANGKQPPALGDAGKASNGEGTLDVKNMSQKDFDALPESTQARLRGDYISA